MVYCESLGRGGVQKQLGRKGRDDGKVG